MIEASSIRAHMNVVGSDGGHVGTVDHVDGDRIKLAKLDSRDGHHHYLPLSTVARVDEHVHLNTTAAAALALGAGGIGATGTVGATRTPLLEDRRKRPAWLPWLLLAIALLAALLLARSCMHRDATPVAATDPNATGAATAPLPVEAVALPNGTSVNLEPRSLNYELQRYLASSEATPKTFQFDKLNFDTGSSAIRAEDTANVDALAQILAAYPKANVRIVGYTDARGSGAANAELGKQRADAVTAALVAKGIDQGRVEATSGGEANPTDTNATSQGQFENRRTELVVTAK